MRLSKRQLRRIIKEEKLKLLKEEPSDYYRDYKNGSISYEDYQQMVKDYEVRTGGSGTRNSNYRPSPRKTSYVGSDANADQIAAVEAALSVKPNNFLTSVLNQLKKGRGLSDKQKSIVKRIVSKNDPTTAALFENKMIITKRQLQRIIKEEYSRVLRESRYTDDPADPIESNEVLQFIEDSLENGFRPNEISSELAQAFSRSDLEFKGR